MIFLFAHKTAACVRVITLTRFVFSTMSDLLHNRGKVFWARHLPRSCELADGGGGGCSGVDLPYKPCGFWV